MAADTDGWSWVGEQDIGIPAKSLFVIVFAALGYFLLCGFFHIVINLGPNGERVANKHVETTLCWCKLMQSEQFWYRFSFFVIASAVGYTQIEDTCGRDEDSSHCNNWHLILWYGVVFIATANVSTKPLEFYLGEGNSFLDTIQNYLFRKHLKTPEEIEQMVAEKYTARAMNEANRGIGFFHLMPSAFVSWIFATSIRNSSVLGGRFGMMGGLAYDSWYLSFFSAAIVCYVLRVRYNFKSLPIAIWKHYGALAVFCFQLCLLFRLFNEVWSNATVIAGFYGQVGSEAYWGACWFSVLVPLTYVLLGGMRTSLFSDVFQAFFAIAFLVIILCTIAGDGDFWKSTDVFSYEPKTLWGSNRSSEGWQPGWWACALGGCVQGIISYPFFDPILTDRAFLGKPKVMLASFFVGGLLAALFIFLFAAVGVYGAWAREKYLVDCGCVQGVATITGGNCPSDWNPCSRLVGQVGEASDVAYILGHRTYIGAEIFMNFIMITASISSLDSAFTSVGKLVSLEFCGWLKLSGDNRDDIGPLKPHDQANIGNAHMTVARASMVALMFIGTCFLGYEKDAMHATTIAGTAIMGIGPPIWWMIAPGRKYQAPLAFLIPFAVGWVFGIFYYIHGQDKEGWTFDLAIGTYINRSGNPVYMSYARFLGTNLIGHGIVIGLFLVFFVFHQAFPSCWFYQLPVVEGDQDEPVEEEKMVEPEQEQVFIEQEVVKVKDADREA